MLYIFFFIYIYIHQQFILVYIFILVYAFIYIHVFIYIHIFLLFLYIYIFVDLINLLLNYIIMLLCYYRIIYVSRRNVKSNHLEFWLGYGRGAAPPPPPPLHASLRLCILVYPCRAPAPAGTARGQAASAWGATGAVDWTVAAHMFR